MSTLIDETLPVYCRYLSILAPSLNFANIPHKNQRSSAFIRGSNLPEIPTSFAPIKALEDQRDALLYAYIRGHWWYWGIERN